jgi:hypothetical protein
MRGRGLALFPTAMGLVSDVIVLVCYIAAVVVVVVVCYIADVLRCIR